MVQHKHVQMHKDVHNLRRGSQVFRSRYPSPANDPEDKDDAYTDYRTSFKDSNFNVKHHESHVVDPSQFKATHLGQGVSTKDYLIMQEILKPEDKDNEQAYEAAKTEYERVSGRTLDSPTHCELGDDKGMMNAMYYMPETLDLQKKRCRQMVEAMFGEIRRD